MKKSWKEIINTFILYLITTVIFIILCSFEETFIFDHFDGSFSPVLFLFASVITLLLLYLLINFIYSLIFKNNLSFKKIIFRNTGMILTIEEIFTIIQAINLRNLFYLVQAIPLFFLGLYMFFLNSEKEVNEK